MVVLDTTMDSQTFNKRNMTTLNKSFPTGGTLEDTLKALGEKTLSHLSGTGNILTSDVLGKALMFAICNSYIGMVHLTVKLQSGKAPHKGFLCDIAHDFLLAPYKGTTVTLPDDTSVPKNSVMSDVKQ